jgi:hypothetical protein
MRFNRPEEAIQADCLYDEFVSKLEENYPTLLERALSQSRCSNELAQSSTITTLKRKHILRSVPKNM